MLDFFIPSILKFLDINVPIEKSTIKCPSPTYTIFLKEIKKFLYILCREEKQLQKEEKINQKKRSIEITQKNHSCSSDEEDKKSSSPLSPHFPSEPLSPTTEKMKQFIILYLLCWNAGNFWSTHFSKDQVPFLEFYNLVVNVSGGNLNNCFGFHSYFLKGYIYENLCCEEEKNNEIVTPLSFRNWIGRETTEEERIMEIPTIFEMCLKRLSKLGPEFDSPGRKLYKRAKDLFIKAQVTPGNIDFKLITESKKHFEDYSELVKANVPLLRQPSEDRHLFYLCEIEDIQRGENGRNWAISELAGRWNAWQRKNGTKTPKQKTGALAREHFSRGEACFLKAIILDEKEQALRLTRFVDELSTVILVTFMPKVLSTVIIGYWSESEVQHTIIKSSSPRYLSHPIHQWELSDVLDWLKVSGLSTHVEVFKQYDVNGSILLSLTDDELKNDLEIRSSLHRKKILKTVSQFTPIVTNNVKVDLDDIDLLFEHATEELEVYNKLIRDPKVTPVDGGKLGDYLRDIPRYTLQRHLRAQATNKHSKMT